MDDQLKQLIQKLGEAINDSLSDSERISEMLGEIKRAGYDVFLVLEATIGFHKRRQPKKISPKSDTSIRSADGRVRVAFTPQDQVFLKEIKISTEDPK